MITHIKGDATEPIGEGVKLLCHIVNDKNQWGAGFTGALSKKWKQPETMYRKMPIKQMGTIQLVEVAEDIFVVNMIAQTLFSKFLRDEIPLNYEALEKCLRHVNKIAERYGFSVHGPKFGSGLAGGNWNVIEQMINDIFKNVNVYIYDLN